VRPDHVRVRTNGKAGRRESRDRGGGDPVHQLVPSREVQGVHVEAGPLSTSPLEQIRHVLLGGANPRAVFQATVREMLREHATRHDAERLVQIQGATHDVVGGLVRMESQQDVAATYARPGVGDVHRSGTQGRIRSTRRSIVRTLEGLVLQPTVESVRVHVHRTRCLNLATTTTWTALPTAPAVHLRWTPMMRTNRTTRLVRFAPRPLGRLVAGGTFFRPQARFEESLAMIRHLQWRQRRFVQAFLPASTSPGSVPMLGELVQTHLAWIHHQRVHAIRVAELESQATLSARHVHDAVRQSIATEQLDAETTKRRMRSRASNTREATRHACAAVARTHRANKEQVETNGMGAQDRRQSNRMPERPVPFASFYCKEAASWVRAV